MPTLRILLADDQIPPTDITDQEFRDQTLRAHGDSEHNRKFLEQCAFMGQVAQALRNSGYHLTTARTFSAATKQITTGEFDLAIIDLCWAMDPSLPRHEQDGAGWSLCEEMDKKDAERGTHTPQIVFSSQFPTHPHLSQEAARRQKLPLFKEATPVVLNSLMATIGFVEATLAAQRAQDIVNPHRFEQELQNVAVDYYKDAKADYRRWALLALALVAISFASIITGVLLAHFGVLDVTTLSSIASLLCTTIAAILYKRLDSAQKAVEKARREVIAELQRLNSKNS